MLDCFLFNNRFGKQKLERTNYIALHCFSSSIVTAVKVSIDRSPNVAYFIGLSYWVFTLVHIASSPRCQSVSLHAGTAVFRSDYQMLRDCLEIATLKKALHDMIIIIQETLRMHCKSCQRRKKLTKEIKKGLETLADFLVNA